ncbi:MAG: MaoC family dehydratase [Acidimicrobiia bacterium]|nr:MaoC family dehydratase [Acidimicrobiia bacterium]
MPTDGPYFDDLHVGQVLDPAPAITVGSEMAAVYQAITGDASPLVLSRPLAEAVTGEPGAIVNPALVLHVSIGQSTVATRRVIANLFYRGVRLLRQVRVGDTLRSTVEIRALRENSRKPGRPPRGTAVLGIRTVDQNDRVVADYERCPMLPLRDDTETGHDDDIGTAEGELDLDGYADLAPSWELGPLGAPVEWDVGESSTDPMGDTVSGALELVRLTQNQAIAHRDPAFGQRGRRLVYGGHTIGLAQASVTRLIPNIATVIGWHSCDHTGPVFEDDVLSFTTTLTDSSLAGSGRILALRVEVEARRDGLDQPVGVLDWRPVVLAP